MKSLKDAMNIIEVLQIFHPRVGLILGSGLGGYAKNMHVEKEIPYREIPDFPVSTVQGHDGKFLLGWIGESTGRCHERQSSLL